MPNFNYVVKDKDGKRLEGVLRSSNVESALDNLKKKGFTPLSVRESRTDILKAQESVADQIATTFYNKTIGKYTLCSIW